MKPILPQTAPAQAAAPTMPDPVRVASPTDPDVIQNARVKAMDEFSKRRGRARTALASDQNSSMTPYTRTTLG